MSHCSVRRTKSALTSSLCFRMATPAQRAQTGSDKCAAKEEPTTAPRRTHNAAVRRNAGDPAWQVLRVVVALLSAVPACAAVFILSIALFFAVSAIICTLAMTALGVVGGIVVVVSSTAMGCGFVMSIALSLLVLFLFVSVALTPVAALAEFVLSLDPRRGSTSSERGYTQAPTDTSAASGNASFGTWRRRAHNTLASYIRGDYNALY